MFIMEESSVYEATEGKAEKTDEGTTALKKQNCIVLCVTYSA